jgi:hypothetical protein
VGLAYIVRKRFRPRLMLELRLKPKPRFRLGLRLRPKPPPYCVVSLEFKLHSQSIFQLFSAATDARTASGTLEQKTQMAVSNVPATCWALGTMKVATNMMARVHASDWSPARIATSVW